MSYIGLLSDNECRELWNRQDEVTKDYDEGRYSISVFSKLSPRNVMQVLDGSVKEFTFPTFAYLMDIHILPEDRKKLGSISYYHARRIRNYLAAVLQHKMPIIWRVSGKDFIMHSSLGDDDDTFSFPRVLQPIWEKTQDQISSLFELKYSHAVRLLENVKSETKLDKCLNLYGSAMWTDDLLDAYSYRWRVIEIIANQEISSIQDSRPKLIDDYVASKVKDVECSCLKEKAKRLESRDKIIISFKEMFPESTLNLDELKEENNLRNKIIHGGIDIGTYENEFKYSMSLWELSKRYLRAELKREFETGETFIM
jgi:hypothetical protein